MLFFFLRKVLLSLEVNVGYHSGPVWLLITHVMTKMTSDWSLLCLHH